MNQNRIIVSALIAVAALVLIGIGSYRGAVQWQFYSACEKAKAKVAQIEVEGDRRTTIVHFFDNKRIFRTAALLEVPFSSINVGDTLPIIYKAHNPKIAKPNTFGVLWAQAIFFVGLGLVTLIGGVIIVGSSLLERGFAEKNNQQEGKDSIGKESVETGEGEQQGDKKEKKRRRRKFTFRRNKLGELNIVELDSEDLNREAVAKDKLSADNKEVDVVEYAGKNRSTQPASVNNSASLRDFPPEEEMYGVLYPLIEDPSVSDIICTRHDRVAVKKGSAVVPTDIKFYGQKDYESFVEQLLRYVDKSYTTAKPIVDAMISPTVRAHAVHPVLCSDGPYLTLRVSRFSTVGYRDLIGYGLAPESVFHYLLGMILSGHTVLIAGEVGCGKTTLLRALAATVSEEDSILVIEDTPEIQIEHPNVRYMRTREANFAGAGKIEPSECIRAGMRMAMNRIIFGEIRDPEAAEAFIDVCISGHSGLSTIHARSAADACNRLALFLSRQQSGVDARTIHSQISTALHVVVYVRVCPHSKQRRIYKVLELTPGVDKPMVQQEIFSYTYLNNQPSWKVHAQKSLYQEPMTEFGLRPILGHLPDVLTLDPKKDEARKDGAHQETSGQTSDTV